MLCKALVFKKDASRIDNWAAFSFDEPQGLLLAIATSIFGQLSLHARRALQRMRRRPTLVCAFWEQAELCPL
jgi:hypothetical protein